MQQPVYIARKKLDPEEEQSKRDRLKNFTENFVFVNVLEKYWGMQIKDHLNNKEELTEEIVLSDCFCIGMKEKDLVVLCIVPQHRCAWDIILALYHLYFPKLYPTTEHVAKLLYSYVLGILKSMEIQNFDPETQLKYLQGMFDENVALEGGNFNWYLIDPYACTWSFSRSLVLLCQGLEGLETEEFVDKYSSLQKSDGNTLREKLNALNQQHKEIATKYKVLNKI